MQGDIVIELDVEDDSNSITKFKRRITNKLLMMEKAPDRKYNPENVKLQYLSDSLRQEFLQQLKETQQRSCQNRNNLLLLIKWLSISNPTLATKLILQRNDVIAKRINGNLMVAPCKSEQSTIENIEFKGDLISKFEIERINAGLEILTQTQKTINSYQMKDELFWQEISEEGEEIIKQMEKEFNEIVLPIEEEFENVITHWKLIFICIIIVTILTILVIIKCKFKLVQALLCNTSKRNSNQATIITLPTESPHTQFITKEEIPPIKLRTFSYIPQNHSLKITS
uniref:Uncharacterized protein n=1 Tax=Brugia malayi TaxID=6279 RepID=A8PH50_BRUMA